MYKILKIDELGNEIPYSYEQMPNLSILQRLAGGLIAPVNVIYNKVEYPAYVNEEGLLLNLRPNRKALSLVNAYCDKHRRFCPFTIVGPLIIIMYDESEGPEYPDGYESQGFPGGDERMDEEPGDGFADSSEADADALASMGWGTDEDYGGGDDRL